MGSDRRFLLKLIGWLVALVGAALAFARALTTPGLGTVRLIAAAAVIATMVGLWQHVTRTNRMIARFLEALRHGDLVTRFDKRGGAAFDQLGEAMDATMRSVQQAQGAVERDLRFHEALIDDAPVAMLVVDAQRGVRVVNKAARRLFDRHEGVRPEDFAIYGATLASRLAAPRAGTRELLILRLGGGLQRALVHVATLDRLGAPVHAVAVEPLQGTLDAVEVAAQTDLVRVLTHEILNSLTPVVSLSSTVDTMLANEPADIGGARAAIATLNRRAASLLTFIDAYRSVARPPVPRPVSFAAQPFADELLRLYRADWPQSDATAAIEPELMIVADPDLLAQALINLLRNAGQATAAMGNGATVRLSMRREDGRLLIEVADNGPGVPEGIRSDIFLPFFTTNAQGSGIGLNLVRQIVVASGGSIEVAAARPSGAIFAIRL